MADPEGGEGASPREILEDYDNYDDGDSDGEALLDVDHSFLERPQKALHDQYTRQRQKLQEELREGSEQLKRLRSEREDTGVSLYAVQQQLARLQLQLGNAHEKVEVAAAAREHVESTLVEYRQLVNERTTLLTEAQQKREQRESELARIHETMREAKKFAEEMRSQIAVTRRVTYKAEEAVKDAEGQKSKQDELIDGVTEQVTQLQEKLALVEAQYLAQKNETTLAADTLAQANAEMTSINVEKKQLVQHWRSALLGMQRRDEALQNAENNLRQEWENIAALEGELRGFKPRLVETASLNEKLVTSLNRVRTEDAFLTKQVGKVEEQRHEYELQFRTFTQDQERLEQELARVTKERDAVRVQAGRLERELQRMLNSLNEFDGSMQHHANEQITHARSAQGAKTDLKRVGERIREQQVLSTQLKNQLAKIRLECLSVGSVTNERRKESERLSREMAEHDELVERYEQEISRRHDEIEKKQAEVDRLNRRYEQMTSNLEEAEHLGPLEATIYNLTKAISSMRQQVQDLEHAWIKKQTELVALVNESNDQSEKIQELNSQVAVLNQRRIRLDGDLDEQNKEIKGLEAGSRRYHADIARLNDLISQNRSSQDSLAESNLVLENEIVRRLKEEEEESVRLESNVDAIAEEKQRLMEDIMEAEKQVLLWEKKIQLGREAMEAIDPTVGSSENAAMAREIQRMEYHIQIIERSKENLVKEMELAVSRREGIAMRGSTAAKSGKQPPRALLAKKNIVELSRRLKQGAADARVCDNELRTLLEIQHELADEISAEKSRLNDGRQAHQEAFSALQWSKYETQKFKELIRMQQRLVKQYKAAAKAPKTYSDAQTDKIMETYKKSAETTTDIRTLIEMLRKEFPEMADYCERMLHSMIQEGE